MWNDLFVRRRAAARSLLSTLLGGTSRWISPNISPATSRSRALKKRMGFELEAIEPRLLLSSDLTYAGVLTPPTFDKAGIEGYIASLISTNYTLKAENNSGNLSWNLYGTGTDLAPIPATLVLSLAIDDAGDLDVNIKRNDLGLTDVLGSGLNLSDFIGDKITIDLGSLSALDGQFGGTTIDIDFAGGKDIDLGTILGLGPSPLDMFANDQLILIGDGGTFNDHPLKVHSSSDIVNDSTGVQITATKDVEIKSDSKVTIDQGSTLVGPNISLLAESKS